jgi:DNA mismatch repair protein MutS
MAGMPPELIERSKEILVQLEQKQVGGKSIGEAVQSLSAPKLQLSIFDAHTQTFDEIRKILEGLDINRLTPVEALLKLNEIKSLLK